MYEIDEKCQKCKNNGTAICNRCDMFYDEFDPIDKPPKTNADRIRAMTDEELADLVSPLSCCHEKGQDCMKYSDGTGGRNCYKCWLDWLKQEANDVGQ